jgi:hypothetical protein
MNFSPSVKLSSNALSLIQVEFVIFFCLLEICINNTFPLLILHILDLLSAMIMVSVIDNIPYSHLIHHMPTWKLVLILNFISEMRTTLNCSAFLPSWAEHYCFGWYDVPNSSRSKKFLFQNIQTGTGGPPTTQPPIEWVLSSSYTGGKAPGNCSYYSHPTSAEFESGGSYTSTLT